MLMIDKSLKIIFFLYIAVIETRFAMFALEYSSPSPQ